VFILCYYIYYIIVYYGVYTSACVCERHGSRDRVRAEIMRRPLKNADENSHKRGAHVHRQLWQYRRGGVGGDGRGDLVWSTGTCSGSFYCARTTPPSLFFFSRISPSAKTVFFPIRIYTIYTSCYYIPLYNIYIILYITHTHTHTHTRLYNIISHILAIALFTRTRSCRRRRFLIVCTHRTRTRVCFCDIRFPESSATLRWVTVRISYGVVFFVEKPPSWVLN